MSAMKNEYIEYINHLYNAYSCMKSAKRKLIDTDTKSDDMLAIEEMIAMLEFMLPISEEDMMNV